MLNALNLSTIFSLRKPSAPPDSDRPLRLERRTRRIKLCAAAFVALTFLSPAMSADAACGNGIKEGNEGCDPGGTTYREGDPNQATCSSGGDCFYEGTCCKFNCQFANPGPCSDGDDCTVTDVCDQLGNCLSGPLGTGNSCDDGIFCNGADTCDNGSCSVHAGDPCTGGGECADTCDEVNDTCNLPVGTGCTSNGIFCDGIEECDGAGVCASPGDPCGGGGECGATCNEVLLDCGIPNGTPCTSDGNPCTDDECNLGACTNINNAAACDDGIFCNGADTCGGGSCSVHAGDPCAANGECNDLCSEGPQTCADPAGTACTDDGNTCTDDECDGAGVCAHPGNTDPCDDGLFCNGADTCAGGTCSGHAGDPCLGGPECADTCDEGGDTCNLPGGTACTADANACTDDECDGAGSCTHPNNTDPCDDGLFCNGADTCSGGSCSGHAGDPCAGGPECADTCDEGGDTCNLPSGTACTDDGNTCTDDECDGAGVCAHLNNGDPCDDGIFCNGTDTCSGGTCSVHSGDPCLGGGECADTCDEVGDTCNLPAATACTDDGNLCTDDECDGAGTCAHPNNSDPCDDLLFCNGTDTCGGGSCSIHTGDPCAAGGECADACDEAGDTCNDPAATVCTDDGNPCTDDACDGAGVCAHPNNTDPCDDGLFCTEPDACTAGTCTGPARDCSDGNDCTDDICNEAGDVCDNPIVGGACEDGDLCTSGDTCVGGVCTAGPPTVCVDGNVCTDDSCNPATGCVFADNADPCDDGLFCTENDVCDSGVCDGDDRDCSDGDQCTSDICDDIGDVCTNPFHSGPCEDGDLCTSNDRCNGAGTCVTGTPTDCDDFNICTDDSCDSGLGCLHPNNNVACDDGDSCTSGDQCFGGVCANGASVCGNGVIDPGCNETCDDGNAADGDGCSAVCESENGDLDVIVTTLPLRPSENEPVMYSIAWANTGPTGLNNASVELDVDTDLVFAEANISPNTQVGSTLTWNLGTLARGASGAIIAYATPADGTAPGTAFISCATMNATVAVTNGNQIQASECTAGVVRDQCDVWYRQVVDTDRFATHALDVGVLDVVSRAARANNHTVEFSGSTGQSPGNDVRIDLRYRDITDSNTLFLRIPSGLSVNSLSEDPTSTGVGTFTFEDVRASAGRITIDATVAPGASVGSILEVTAQLTDDAGNTVSTTHDMIVCGGAFGGPCNDRPPSIAAQTRSGILPGTSIRLNVRFRQATDDNTVQVTFPSVLTVESVSPLPDSQSAGSLAWDDLRAPNGAVRITLGVPADAVPGTVYSGTAVLTNNDTTQSFDDVFRSTVRSSASEFDGKARIDYRLAALSPCVGSGGMSVAGTIPAELEEVRAVPAALASVNGTAVSVGFLGLEPGVPANVVISGKVDTNTVDDGLHLLHTTTATDASGDSRDSHCSFTVPPPPTGESPILSLRGQPAVRSGRKMRYNVRYTGLSDSNRIVMSVPPEMTITDVSPAAAGFNNQVLVWNNVRGPAGTLRVRGEAALLSGDIVAGYASSTVTVSDTDGSNDIQTWHTLISKSTSKAKRLKLGGQNIMVSGRVTQFTGRYKRIANASRIELSIPSQLSVVETDPQPTTQGSGLIVWDNLSSATAGNVRARVLLNNGVAEGTEFDVVLTLFFGAGETLQDVLRIRVK